jgi:hypothetical protein
MLSSGMISVSVFWVGVWLRFSAAVDAAALLQLLLALLVAVLLLLLLLLSRGRALGSGSAFGSLGCSGADVVTGRRGGGWVGVGLLVARARFASDNGAASEAAAAAVEGGG